MLQTVTILILTQLLICQSQTACLPRRSWDSLNEYQKVQFVNGVSCLMQPQTSLNSSTPSQSRYDDFVYHHMAIADAVHFTPAFLPFHRVFLSAFESALQTCNGGAYSNVTIPYWDPATNNNSISSFSGFSNTLLGGTGSAGTGCVEVGNGIAGGRQAIYPNAHCLTRVFNLTFIQDNVGVERMLGRTFANPLNVNTFTYENFRVLLETTLHSAVHFGIGGIGVGDMAAAGTATNDPFFWIHHANIDRIWQEWQLTFPNLANSYTGVNEFRATVSDRDVIDLGLIRQLITGPLRGTGPITVNDTFAMCPGNIYGVSGTVLNGAFVSKGISDMRSSAGFS